MTIDLVVARHRERVEWTRNVPERVRVVILDKGGDLDPALVPRAEVRRLPNVGREAHSYLSHLLERHEDPASLTVFCQGHPFDHAHDLHDALRALAAGSLEVRDFHWLGFIQDTDDARGLRLFVPWSRNEDGRELQYDRFHRELFDEPSPALVRFHPGAQFVVSAEAVRAVPRELLERALRLSEAFPDAAHCFERAWDRFFSVVGVPEEAMGGAMTRYLKPIRRLRDAP